jgi:hypothetical protein
MSEIEDAETVVAVEVIKRLLALISSEKQLDVLALLKANVEAEQEEIKKNGGYVLHWLDLSDESWKNSPYHRYRGRIMRFKSLVLQVFARDIINNHSPENAARILFAEHRNGHGSGYLPDYLNHLPGIKVDFNKIAAFQRENGATY